MTLSLDSKDLWNRLARQHGSWVNEVDLSSADAGVQLIEAAALNVILFAAIEKQLSVNSAHPSYFQFQEALGHLYSQRFDMIRGIDDARVCIHHWDMALTKPLSERGTESTNIYHNLGRVYRQIFLAEGNLIDLKQALMLNRAAVQGTPLGHPSLGAYQQGLATSHSDAYERLGDKADLILSVMFDRAAVEATFVGDPELPIRLQGLAVSYTNRYYEDGSIEDLALSLHYKKAALMTTPPHHHNLPDLQRSLAVSYTMQYERLGHMEDFEVALSYSQEAVKGTSLGHPDLAERQRSLAVLHGQRYHRLGNINDLEVSLLCYKAAVESLPDGHHNLPKFQQSLAVGYTDSYEAKGDIEDLAAALKYDKAALDGTPADHADLSFRQHGLAMTYLTYYQNLGDLHDLRCSLEYGEAAIKSTPPGNETLHSQHLQSLAAAYTASYQRLGNLNDLEVALSYKKKAMEQLPSDHPDLPMYQQSLSVSYTDRYERLDDIEDLELALKYDQAAVNNTPYDHPELPSRKLNLASTLGQKYQRLGNLNDLEMSIQYTKEALEHMHSNYMDLPKCQQELAVLYMLHYQRLGGLTDLEFALKYASAAVEGTPSDHPMSLAYQESLAISYSSRYQHLGDLADLETSLKLKENILQNTPSDHTNLPYCHQLLALSYLEYYKRSKNPKDLESSVMHNKLAVEGTAEDHPDLPEYQEGLALSLTARYREFGKLEDLQDALMYDLKALATTPSNHPDLPGRHHNLAVSYTDRFVKLQEIADLEAALEHDTAAVNGASEDYPGYATYCQNLSVSYVNYYERWSDVEYLYCALYYAHKSIDSLAASPSSKWEAALSMAEWTRTYNLPQIVRAYSAAFSVLPELLWIGTSLPTRYSQLIYYDISKATSLGVAAAIQYDEFETAVEFLEQGLSITHKQSLELHDEHTQLYKRYPSEALRLKELSMQLNQIQLLSWQKETINKQLDYFHISVERQKLIKKIQSYPEFHNLFSPPTYEKLVSCSKNGPVIILNWASSKGDAIIIFEKSLKHVPLYNVSKEELKQQLHNLKVALNACHIQIRNDKNRFGQPAKPPVPQQLFQNLLFWLWKTIVQPVFLVLNKIGVASGRIWWCPSGAFIGLPIHAAAPLGHSFIQSYTYTLDALIKAQESSIRMISSNDSEIMTAIGVTDIPGEPHLGLPLVKEEVVRVASACKDSNCKVQMILDSEATIKSTLNALTNSTWLHLACHGYQDPTDPLKSYLHLVDGKLELKQIIDTHLCSSAKMVFLSACQTAMGDKNLINEAMHLSGAFIAAGFQGAIGTLWNMADADGPMVAEVVYQHIFNSQTKTHNVMLAAEGLKIAIEKLQRQGAPFERWMPYIHVGL
ncbi:CHAT domain-containing protein [Collybia nuda]|uniref:CHAT domain-containing protein n=1 Tax=Collybia nuda TaxID=64659 RepID=A0A9P5YFK3_9AGAR|nr:CHAT domain-containing protein [Collybia nuda]